MYLIYYGMTHMVYIEYICIMNIVIIIVFDDILIKYKYNLGNLKIFLGMYLKIKVFINQYQSKIHYIRMYVLNTTIMHSDLN